eukprot:1158629-Pelagomonas_calceolata.AAC.3
MYGCVGMHKQCTSCCYSFASSSVTSKSKSLSSPHRQLQQHATRKPLPLLPFPSQSVLAQHAWRPNSGTTASVEAQYAWRPNSGTTACVVHSMHDDKPPCCVNTAVRLHPFWKDAKGCAEHMRLTHLQHQRTCCVQMPVSPLAMAGWLWHGAVASAYWCGRRQLLRAPVQGCVGRQETVAGWGAADRISVRLEFKSALVDKSPGACAHSTLMQGSKHT